MAEYTTIAAVDLGSNSFHCQIARVDGEQTYPLDGLRESVRLGAGRLSVFNDRWGILAAPFDH